MSDGKTPTKPTESVAGSPASVIQPAPVPAPSAAAAQPLPVIRPSDPKPPQILPRVPSIAAHTLSFPYTDRPKHLLRPVSDVDFTRAQADPYSFSSAKAAADAASAPKSERYTFEWAPRNYPSLPAQTPSDSNAPSASSSQATQSPSSFSFATGRNADGSLISDPNSQQQSQPRPAYQPPPFFTIDPMKRRAEEYLEQNLRLIRVVSWAGPAIAGIILLSRLRGFRRIKSVGGLPDRAVINRWRLRGLSKIADSKAPPKFIARDNGQTEAMGATLQDVAAPLRSKNNPLGAATFSSPTNSRLVINVISAQSSERLDASPYDIASTAHMGPPGIHELTSITDPNALERTRLVPTVPAVFYFHHTPLLREWLWFNPSSDSVPLLKCELAGLRLADIPEARERLTQLVHNKKAYFEIIERDQSRDLLIGVLKERKWFRPRDVGEQLAQEGFACLHVDRGADDTTAETAAFRILKDQLGSKFRAYSNAEDDARDDSRGMWRAPERGGVFARFQVPQVASAVGSAMGSAASTVWGGLKTTAKFVRAKTAPAPAPAKTE